MNERKIKSELSRMERQRHALEQKIKLLQRKEIMALPGRVGLDTIDSLILALVEYASPSMQARFKTAGISEAAGAGGAAGKANGTRAKFSSELRARIKDELEAGLKSVAQISREFGPSHPTIMGWKREWKMTRPRGRKTRKGAAADDDERH